MKKKYAYIVPLLLLGIFASGAVTYAMQFGAKDGSGYTSENMFRGNMHKTDMNERRLAVQTALENNDYNAFMEMMQRRPNAPSVTEEEFNTMQKAHTLCAQGEFQQARDLLDAAGIERPQRMSHR